MKYIVVDRGGFDMPILFPEHVEHYDAAKGAPGKVVSAGFAYLENGEVRVQGKSLSLQMGPREIDAVLIKVLLSRPAPETGAAGILHNERAA